MPKRIVIYTMDEILPEIDGQYYGVRGKYLSRDDGRHVVKSARGFGDLESAYAALEIWRDMGFRGSPASPASFFRQVFGAMRKAGHIKCRITKTENNLFRKHFRYAWIEAMERGFIEQPVYHYDMNAAYYWASTLKYPSRFRPFRTGDRKYIALVKDVRGELVPGTLRTKSGYAILTSELKEFLSLGGELVHAVSYDDYDVDLSCCFDALEGILPQKMFKRVTQSFWGTFCPDGLLSVDSIRGGCVVKSRMQESCGQNFGWAALTVQRVIGRAAEAFVYGDGVQVYVDSILAKKRLPFVSAERGCWKLVSAFPNGVVIRAPGVFCDLPAPDNAAFWYRHSGIQGFGKR